MRRSVNNTIGGTAAGALNIISGNLHGVELYGGAGNVVSGNYIGTDVTGSVDLGNYYHGVWVRDDDASGHTIGGTEAGAGNVISGNNSQGILLDDSVTTIVVQGNYIGTDASGTVALGNGASGVLIENGAMYNTIGGTVAGARNVISGHPLQGVEVQGHNNLIQGNYIGTDATGTVAMGNGQVGIWFRSGSTYNIAGGTEPGAGNVLSANGEDGLNFGEAGTEHNVAMGNYIGTDATGTGPIPNVERGVRTISLAGRSRVPAI
jgi:titin